MQVRYTDDRRSVHVTTKATAPGGVRTGKQRLPGAFCPQMLMRLMLLLLLHITSQHA